MRNPAKISLIALLILLLAVVAAVVKSNIELISTMAVAGGEEAVKQPQADMADSTEQIGKQELPIYSEKTDSSKQAEVRSKRFDFEDKSVFEILSFDFKEGTTSYTHQLDISGSEITIYSQNYDISPRRLEVTQITDNLPKRTLYISTDSESIVVSIPALYKKEMPYNTIECLPDLEQPAIIEKTGGGYRITLEFTPTEASWGELWYYRANEIFPKMTEDFLPHDLHQKRRFSHDGYYYKTYANYVPFAENGFFRNAADYTGAFLLTKPYTKNIGYAMTYICLNNQNSLGFWETGARSEWLYNDYGVDHNFYDTRFSTDFARSLLAAYTTFGDDKFLEGAEKYAEFLRLYAENIGYKIIDEAGGANGVLLPDYWSPAQKKKPHVSLNHQLAEINFLLELYIINNDDSVLQNAKAMLSGIELKESEWILEDNNLKYAVLYEEGSNKMVDYPYLTYNDLFDTRELLRRLGADTGSVERLMAAKKDWMDRNGVTAYKKGND